MRRGEIILSAFCLAFFSFMFYEAFQLHNVRRFGEVGSGFWPMLSLGFSLLLSLSWLVSTLAAFFAARSKTVEALSQEMLAEARARRKRVVLGSVCLIVYIAAMPRIGFLLSTLLFIPAFVLALGERRKWILIISPLLVTALTILIFARFVAIPFPKGEGIFAEFSRLFY